MSSFSNFVRVASTVSKIRLLSTTNAKHQLKPMLNVDHDTCPRKRCVFPMEIVNPNATYMKDKREYFDEVLKLLSASDGPDSFYHCSAIDCCNKHKATEFINRLVKTDLLKQTC